MNDFEIKQVESDDPETFKYIIQLPAEYCTPEYLELLKQLFIEQYIALVSNFIQEGVRDGRSGYGPDQDL